MKIWHLLIRKGQNLPWDVKQQVEINLKYEGYIKTPDEAGRTV